MLSSTSLRSLLFAPCFFQRFLNILQIRIFFFLWLNRGIDIYKILCVSLAEIWDALRAAAEAELSLAQAIVDSAGVIVASVDMTTCYDERG